MKLLRVMLVVFAIGFSTNSNALNIHIKGVASCGIWVKDRTEKIQSPLIWMVDQSWLLGFLSGMAIGTSKDVLKGIDSASIVLWMDNYCQKNPLNGTDDGGQELFLELMARTKK